MSGSQWSLFSTQSDIRIALCVILRRKLSIRNFQTEDLKKGRTESVRPVLTICTMKPSFINKKSIIKFTRENNKLNYLLKQCRRRLVWC